MRNGHVERVVTSFRHCSQQWAPWSVPSRVIMSGAADDTRSAIARGVLELLSETAHSSTER